MEAPPRSGVEVVRLLVDVGVAVRTDVHPPACRGARDRVVEGLAVGDRRPGGPLSRAPVRTEVADVTVVALHDSAAGERLAVLARSRVATTGGRQRPGAPGPVHQEDQPMPVRHLPEGPG